MRASAGACMCAHIGAGATVQSCGAVGLGARSGAWFSRCFGVGFISKSKSKMTCGAGKNRTKNGNKKAKKSR